MALALPPALIKLVRVPSAEEAAGAPGLPPPQPRHPVHLPTTSPPPRPSREAAPLLPQWLRVAAGLRAFSVALGYLSPKTLGKRVYDTKTREGERCQWGGRPPDF